MPRIGEGEARSLKRDRKCGEVRTLVGQYLFLGPMGKVTMLLSGSLIENEEKRKVRKQALQEQIAQHEVYGFTP